LDFKTLVFGLVVGLQIVYVISAVGRLMSDIAFLILKKL